MKRISLLTLMCITLSSCTGSAAIIEALAKDNATVCAKVTTIYGTLTVARTNIESGNVKCDSLEVTTTGQTNVPVTVVPSTTLSPVPVTIVK